jgi:hypothetical protein
MIQEIVSRALKLLFYPGANQYLYYYVDSGGEEWVAIAVEYDSGYYELRTAYRADCTPYECEDSTGETYEVDTYLDQLICEGFRLVSLW